MRRWSLRAASIKGGHKHLITIEEPVSIMFELDVPRVIRSYVHVPESVLKRNETLD